MVLSDDGISMASSFLTLRMLRTTRTLVDRLTDLLGSWVDVVDLCDGLDVSCALTSVDDLPVEPILASVMLDPKNGVISSIRRLRRPVDHKVAGS